MDAAHPSFTVFLGGLSLIWLAGLSQALRRSADRRLPWTWLTLFGLGQGLSQWLGLLGTQLPDSWAFQTFGVLLAAGSWAALSEFGRRGFSAQKGRGPGRWMYLPLLLVVAGGGLCGGLSGLQTACQYALGVPGGLLAGLALSHGSKHCARTALVGLALAALAIGAYAPAMALSLPALRAILSLAALIGVRLFHAASGLPTARNSLLRRCALPAAFLLAAALGGAGTRWLDRSAEAQFEEVAVADAAAAEDTADTEGAAGESVEAPSQFESDNWDAVAAERQQLGIPVMLTVLVLIAVLIGIGAAAART